MIALAIRLVAALGIPERFRRAAAWASLILAAIALLWLAKTLYDRSIIREHEREIVEEVQRKTDKGNAAATEAAQETQGRIEQENDNARKAADGSDDPLKSALDRLR